MSIEFFALGAGSCEGTDPEISLVAAEPALRRASKQMLAALIACRRALSLAQGLVDSEPGLVLGTGHGELQVTYEFLEALEKRKLARPFLFQNSLHNSTAGFLAMQLSLKGPVLTVSRSWFSGEDALEVGSDWIRQERAQQVLVLGTDFGCSSLEVPLGTLYPPSWPQGSGAGAVLLCRPEQARYQGAFESINPLINLQAKAPSNGQARFDSDFIYRLAREITSSTAGSAFCLSKPDGGETSVKWAHHVRA